jgi:hypothetical protein
MMKFTVMLKLHIMGDSGRPESGSSGGCGGGGAMNPRWYFYLK